MTDLMPSVEMGLKTALIPEGTSEGEKRLITVNSQFDIEWAAAQGDNVAMAFCVEETKLTPLFFRREDVYKDDKDGLYKLKGFNPDDIIFVGFDSEHKPIYWLDPACPPTSIARFLAQLMPLEKAKDPKQLSTVLGRVVTLDLLREKGVKLVIIGKNEKRKRVDEKTEFVDFPKGSVGEKYKSNTSVQFLGSEYAIYEATTSSASYVWKKDGKVYRGAVTASQMSNPNAPKKFVVLVNDDAIEAINNTNALLKRRGEPTLDQRAGIVVARRPKTPDAKTAGWCNGVPKFETKGPMNGCHPEG